MTMTHDPECYVVKPASTSVVCICERIARVREDERTYTKQTSTAIMAYDEGKRDGYAAALRDAVEVVEDRIQDLSTCNKDDECHTLGRGAALALSDIQAYLLSCSATETKRQSLRFGTPGTPLPCGMP